VNGFVPPVDGRSAVSEAERAVTQAAQDDPGFEEALSGGDDPQKGCNAQGNVQVFGQPDIFEALYDLDNRDSEAQSRSTSDPAVIVAQAVWAECMGKAGLSYATIDSLYSVMWSEPRPGAEELAAATANWHCLSDSHYREALSAAYVTAVEDYASTHESELAGLKEVLAAEVAAAT